MFLPRKWCSLVPFRFLCGTGCALLMTVSCFGQDATVCRTVGSRTTHLVVAEETFSDREGGRRPACAASPVDCSAKPACPCPSCTGTGGFCNGTGAFSSLWTADRLTGNWGGRRPCLAEHGVTLQADVTQFYMGVVEGGVDREFRYSGHGDYVMLIDAGKMRGPQGLLVKLRAEHRFGESLAGATGASLPSNILADLPVSNSEEVYLTNVLFTQMLSETFGVFLGKLDTLDGDANAFAHGRGKTQFSNMAFVANPIALRTVPYATLGAGFLILREGAPIFTFSVLNPTDTTRTSGFDELFNEGVTLTAELRLPTRFLDRPGHQLFAGTWSSRNFVALGQDPRIILPNVPIQEKTGSWSLYWNFDQYLFVDPCDPGRGWGVFGRAGLAEDKANALESFLSFGVGGQGLFRNRRADTYGAGWYYVGTSSEIGPLLQTVLGPIGDGQGLELFYNAEITPAFHLTFDLQVDDPARERIDTAVLLGLRANLNF